MYSQREKTDERQEPSASPARASAQPLIEMTRVTKEFVVRGERFAAVQDITLSVQAHEFVTIVGPSGCGKSTLLNMTAGLYQPTLGTVSYRGSAVTGLNHAVGYMTQDDYLLPWRTVAANVSVPLQIAGIPKTEREERVRTLLETVGLAGFERHYPSQLSGGMKKRCALAQLLAYDPETLLLDEPFAALDAQLRLMLQRELLRLCRRFRKTVLFVTHDLDEAVALGERCVIFTGRPARISRELAIDLPAERDPLTLRFDPHYVELTQALWNLMAPELEVKP